MNVKVMIEKIYKHNVPIIYGKAFVTCCEESTSDGPTGISGLSQIYDFIFYIHILDEIYLRAKISCSIN